MLVVDRDGRVSAELKTDTVVVEFALRVLIIILRERVAVEACPTLGREDRAVVVEVRLATLTTVDGRAGLSGFQLCWCGRLLVWRAAVRGCW